MWPSWFHWLRNMKRGEFGKPMYHFQSWQHAWYEIFGTKMEGAAWTIFLLLITGSWISVKGNNEELDSISLYI